MNFNCFISCHQMSLIYSKFSKVLWLQFFTILWIIIFFNILLNFKYFCTLLRHLLKLFNRWIKSILIKNICKSFDNFIQQNFFLLIFNSCISLTHLNPFRMILRIFTFYKFSSESNELFLLLAKNNVIPDKCNSKPFKIYFKFNIAAFSIE